MSSDTPPATHNGVLYVEVKLISSDRGGQKVREIKDDVESFIRRQHAEIRIGTVVNPGRLTRPDPSTYLHTIMQSYE